MSTPERKAGDSLLVSGQRPCVERCELDRGEAIANEKRESAKSSPSPRSSSEAVHAEPHFRPDRKITLPCSCVGNCEIVVLCEFLDDDTSETYVDFWTHYRVDTWRDRIRTAWKSLRGSGYHHGVVWEPEQVAALRTWLNSLETFSERIDRFIEEDREVIDRLADS